MSERKATKIKRVSKSFYIALKGGEYVEPPDAKTIRVKGYSDLFLHRMVDDDGKFTHDWWNVSDGVTGHMIGNYAYANPRRALEYAVAALTVKMTPPEKFMAAREKLIRKGFLSPRYQKVEA